MRSNVPETINVGLIGYGTVGTGVVKYFHDGWAQPHGVNLKRVTVKHLSKTRPYSVPSLTDDTLSLVNDPSIQIVVELMGGLEPARGFMLRAIDNGKSVVNGNKQVMARHMRELFDAASSQGVDIGIEASVAGGIPIIDVFRRYQGDRVNKLIAIINGTTNFILTKMSEDKQDFGTALKTAQRLGYAEQDPRRDIEGLDSQDKLGVLACLAFNTQIDVNRIACAGITDLTSLDIEWAKGERCEIKLLAIADRMGDVVDLQVTPALIGKDHPLVTARGVFNAVYIEAEWAKSQLFLGRGAGMEPTTAAVISDILHIADNIRAGKQDGYPTLDSRVNYMDHEQSVQHLGTRHLPFVTSPEMV